MRSAVDVDAAAVHLDRPFCDRQPETGAATVPRPGFIEAKETIEDLLAVFDGDPRSFVGNGEKRLASIESAVKTTRKSRKSWFTADTSLQSS